MLKEIGVEGKNRLAVTVVKFGNIFWMENSSELLGLKELIRKHEFVRIIIQCLYSLGYSKSASSLEAESGISYKSLEFKLL